jgi:hypothetical protein
MKAAMLKPKGSDFKSISDFNFEWSERLAILILVGLVIDVANFFISSHTCHVAVGITANSFIFFGIWGELRFAKRARDADDSRVAESERATAEAKLETEKLRTQFAGRKITLEQHDAMVEALREIAPSLDVFIEFQNGDPEAFSYANALAKVFMDAGTPQPHGGTNMHLSPSVVFGVLVTVFAGISLETISKAFTDGGIAFTIRPGNPVSLPKKHPRPNVEIFVGAKPPPEFLLKPANA